MIVKALKPFKEARSARLVLAALAVLGLTACQPATGDVSRSSPNQRADAVVTPVDLRGSWRLASFEGGPTDPVHDHEIVMLATSRSLRASSQCVQIWRTYDWTAQGLRVGPHGPVLSCMRGLTQTEQAFGDALSSVTQAERVGHELILISGEHRLVFEPGRTPDVVDLTGRWRLRSLHGQMPGENEAIVVTFHGSTMTAASGCMRAAWTYEQVGGALEITRSDAESCERMRTPWESQFFDILDTVRSAVALSSEQLVLDGAIGQMELDRLS